MKSIKTLLIVIFVSSGVFTPAQDYTVKSPDNNIIVSIMNGENLTYSVTFKSQNIINQSPMGFEFKDEEPMTGNFVVTDQKNKSINETWIPVVKSKHSQVIDNYNELHLYLKEKSAPMRQMELIIRAYNDGTAFQYKLSRAANIGDRQITRELTTFNIPGDPKAWIVEYGKYSTSNEAEFFEHPLSYMNEKTIAGMPLLMEFDKKC
jgi:alpha-glucosidase